MTDARCPYKKSIGNHGEAASGLALKGDDGHFYCKAGDVLTRVI
jgi:hypothetical protein